MKGGFELKPSKEQIKMEKDLCMYSSYKSSLLFDLKELNKLDDTDIDIYNRKKLIEIKLKRNETDIENKRKQYGLTDSYKEALRVTQALEKITK